MTRATELFTLLTLLLIFLFLAADMAWGHDHILRDDCLALIVSANLICVTIQTNRRRSPKNPVDRAG
jgi:hypothetical protein